MPVWWLLQIPFRVAVGNSPPFWNESPFQTFTPKFQPEFMVYSFDEFTPPKRRFWKVGRTFPNAFSKHFSRVWVLDLGYKPLKSASKTHSEMFFRPPKSSFGDHRIVWHGDSFQKGGELPTADLERVYCMSVELSRWWEHADVSVTVTTWW